MVWKNGLKNIHDVTYLFKVCEHSLKYEIATSITESIKAKIWEQRTEKEVWSYIAMKELEVSIFYLYKICLYWRVKLLIFL